MIITQIIKMDKSHRMDSNRIINDKFEPGQTPSIIRDEGEMEGIIWISHIHHDLRLRLFEMFHVEVLHLKIKKPFVNHSSLTLWAPDVPPRILFKISTPF